MQGRGNFPLALVVPADHCTVKEFPRVDKSRQSFRNFFAVIKSSRANELALYLVDQGDFGKTLVDRVQSNDLAFGLVGRFLHPGHIARASERYISKRVVEGRVGEVRIGGQ